MFLEFLLLPFMPPCLVWLLVPPLPQASISGFHTSPGEIPLVSLVASKSFSGHSTSADEEGNDERTPVLFLRRLCLTSVPRSSAEDESLPPLLSCSSSLSSEPWWSVPREFRLLLVEGLRFRCDLVINPPAGSLPSVRLLTSASDCRWRIWAMDAWICQFGRLGA